VKATKTVPVYCMCRMLELSESEINHPKKVTTEIPGESPPQNTYQHL